MKKSDAKKLINTMEEVFDIVRIIEPETKEVLDLNSDTDVMTGKKCYEFWGRTSDCENCSMDACDKEAGELDRFKTADDRLYYVSDKPIEINDKKYFMEIMSEVRNEDKEKITKVLSEKEDQDMEIINILASEYTSVYHIDLNTDELTTYTMNEDTESAFGSIFRTGITYTEAYDMYVDTLVYDDDKAEMLEAGSIANISKALRDKKTFVTSYRSSEGRYCEMKFVKVNGEQEIPTAVALGFSDRDEEIRARQREEEEKERNNKIIEILASEYSSVYYIDLKTDELNPYAMNAETESEFGQIFNSGITYSEAFKLYVDKLIYAEDKAMMLQTGAIENIEEQLKNQKTFITQYRSTDNRYSEMKFVKVNEENEYPTAVALGFADRDEEIRREQKQEEERQRNTEIIEILSSEYTSVYYIDLTTDKLTPYNMNRETETQFGVLFKDMDYSEAFRMYVDTLIVPADKEKMLKAGSIGNIMNELRNKKTFITTYQSENEGNPHYCEMKFVKVGEEEGAPKAVALGFADKDEELRNRIEGEIIRKKNTDIIEILASEYTSVYYIDLTTDELTPYSMNEETESEFGQIFRSGITYSAAYKMYVNTLVFEEDKELMLRAGSIYSILTNLHDKKTFLTTYRSDNNGDPHYCEMKFVKVGDEENPEAVALGFADKDEEIRNRIGEETIRKRNTEIIEILASEYSSVYYIDLDTDELNPYTMNAETESEFGQIFNSGITYSEAFKLYVDRLIFPDDKEMMLNTGSIDNIRRQLLNQKTFLTQYRSSDNRYSEMKFVKVNDENDLPTAVALGFADKDEELREALRIEQEREKDFEIIDILASEYTSVYYIDLDTDELTPYSMNDRALEYFGDAFVGATYSDAFKIYVGKAVAEESRTQMLQAGSIDNIRKMLKKQKTFITTYLNEANLYAEMKFVKVGDEDDEPKAVALGFSVVDEQFRNELMVKQREEFINGLADDYEAVFHVDADDRIIETIRISDEYLQRNPLLGGDMDYSEYVNAVASNIIEDDRQAFIDALSEENVNAEFRRENAFFHNYRILRDGKITYYQLKLIYVGDWEKDRSFLIGVHNMDELTRAQVAQEEALDEAREEAETANRAKTTFLFNMSHDIRTPMNAIIGFNNMAMKNLDNKEKIQDCLSKVNTSSQHLLGILNDVLDMARIESGKVTISEEPVIITEAATDLSNIVKQTVKDKNLTIETDFSNIQHNHVCADELRVNRVLMNILSNAVKYTGQDGVVKYRINEIGSSREGYARYEFIVEDNGIGMSEEFLKHIFESFSRESTSTVSGIQGTGLGMAITKELVDLMGGTIDIASEVDRGTTVTITMEFRIASDEYVESDSTEVDEHEILKGKRVLLVEDNELNREIAVDMLEEYGLEVEEADDGDVAVEICRSKDVADLSQAYDFILMDVQMPKMDGYKATKLIRNLPDGKGENVCIIATTANAFSEDRDKAMESGMNAHLGKPLEIKKLMKTLISLDKTGIVV